MSLSDFTICCILSIFAAKEEDQETSTAAQKIQEVRFNVKCMLKGPWMWGRKELPNLQLNMEGAWRTKALDLCRTQ